MRDEVRDYLTESGAALEEVRDVREVAANVDVIYVTRAQTTRLEHAQRFEGDAGWYTVDEDVMSRLPAGGRVLHPLPRGSELPTSVDADERVVCFRQAANGLYVRMALLTLLAQQAGG
jgi:aspartate carbamoyltransferase catalytic subunit